MDFYDFLKTSGAGGELLASQAWGAAIAAIKAGLPDHHAEIDAAVASFPPRPEPEPAPAEPAPVVPVAASDSGTSTEGT